MNPPMNHDCYKGPFINSATRDRNAIRDYKLSAKTQTTQKLKIVHLKGLAEKTLTRERIYERPLTVDPFSKSTFLQREDNSKIIDLICHEDCEHALVRASGPLVTASTISVMSRVRTNHAAPRGRKAWELLRSVEPKRQRA